MFILSKYSIKYIETRIECHYNVNVISCIFLTYCRHILHIDVAYSININVWGGTHRRFLIDPKYTETV